MGTTCKILAYLAQWCFTPRNLAAEHFLQQLGCSNLTMHHLHIGLADSFVHLIVPDIGNEDSIRARCTENGLLPLSEERGHAYIGHFKLHHPDEWEVFIRNLDDRG